MRGRHAAVMIHMNQQTRAALQGWLLRQKTPVGRAKRARGMLLLEQGHSYAHTAKWVGLTERNLRKWARRFHEHGVAGLDEKPRPGRTPVFPAEVALYIVKLACERPDNMGRSLSQWDCPELARLLKADGIVQSISPETIGRILRSHKLKPWRHHLWLSAKVPRDEHFAKLAHTLVELYTRPLAEEEMVLCVDEKTNLSRVPAWLPRFLRDPAFRLTWNMSTNAQEHCTCLPLLIPVLARSMLGPRYANGKLSSLLSFPSWSESFPQPRLAFSL